MESCRLLHHYFCSPHIRFMRQLLILLFCSLSISAFSQPHMNFNNTYDTDWKKVDELINQDLPKSAREQVEKIYQAASGSNNQTQMLKAQIYFLRLNNQDNEQADSLNIAKAESEIKKTPFPLNAVWKSIAAQLYWNYYQNNRYKILQRSTTSEAIGTDFEQWDAAKFAAKTTELYRGSLVNAAGLKNVLIKDFDPVLVKGKNTATLRPSLFDLLAFRAIDFFENDEAGISKPAFAFSLDNPQAFAPAEQFTSAQFQTQDTGSNEFQALVLYQEILKMHASDKNPDALLDADLQRINFVYHHSVHPDKNKLYEQALSGIESKYPNNPLSARASFSRINNQYSLKDHEPWDDQEPTAKEKNQTNWVAVVKELEALIKKFPGSEGAINAQQRIAELKSRSLSIKAEEVVLPNQASKVLLQYRNIDKVWIRILKTDVATIQKMGSYGNEKFMASLLEKPVLSTLSTTIPGSDDLHPHSAELKLDALPTGMYTILVSARADFKKEDNTIAFTTFQVSKLAVITQASPSKRKLAGGYILDRANGNPIADCKVTLYRQVYNNRNFNYEFKPVTNTTSAKDGSFSTPDNGEGYNGMSLQAGNDELFSADYLNFLRYDPEQNEGEQTFFFTDRSIYRPGQTIYFKAIVVKTSADNISSSVVPNKEIELSFFDVNYQKIASKKLTTNEWGSISGTFVAPVGTLGGRMHLEGNNGSIYFSVEEYKRPKFHVDWDTMKTDYALNEQIAVIGHAQAYAGNNIDGAVVNYRVVRNVRWPSWWYYWRFGGRNGDAQEIAQGSTTTDAAGKFVVKFQTLPDRNVDERSLPIFTYTIHADVTDLNGETRSGEKHLSAGYRSLQIETTIPELATRESLNNLSLRSSNLNGDFIPATIHLKIARLQQPETLYRKRLWSTPDQFLMSEKEYRESFPLDAYKDEDDYKTWATAAITAEQNLKTTKDGKLSLPASYFPNNGWYLLSFSTKDKNGLAVEEKKYVQVWDAENPGKPYSVLLLLNKQTKVEPGQFATTRLISGLPQLHLIRQVQTMDDKILSQQENLNNAGNESTWKKEITEADRGGIGLSYISIKDNRVYTASTQVSVPWSNKELNIKWETHRDKLQPGAQETWTMIVEGNKKDKVAAEMVAALYDASLDAFQAHSWAFGSLYPTLNSYLSWNTQTGFGIAPSRNLGNFNSPKLPHYIRNYDRLIDFGQHGYGAVRRYARGGRNMELLSDAAAPREGALMAAAPIAAEKSSFNAPALKKNEEVSDKLLPTQDKTPEISVRKNLQETAFFYPSLHTDANGAVRISFTMPEALTEWKLLTFAHTKDMRTGFNTGSVKTQKDLMVQPGLPRFLRQGDEIVLATKITNLSDHKLTGIARLEIIDPATNLPLNLPFRLKENSKPFSVEKGASTHASWTITVSEARYEPVIIRIIAQAGNFSDAEENTIPVLTNRMLVTETLPLWINGNGSKQFQFEKLLQSGTSNTLAQHALTVEYTANPAWYAIQALPFLMEYPYECAEQTFNRYYANALAAHILEQAPRVKAIFKKWETLDTAALQSNLEKNQELKTALLEETPWVLDAKNETQQKHNIALLFQTAKLARALDKTARQLEDMMLPEGGFPWFRGDSRPDRYITQYIVTGIGRLKKLGIANNTLQEIASRALPYLDRMMEQDYRDLLKEKADLKAQQIGNFDVQYLYMKSFFTQPNSGYISKEAQDFYRSQAQKFWPKFNAYTKGMIALALFRNQDTETPKMIIRSLKETAIEKDELGMYWMDNGRSWWWWDAPIEAQSLLIECFGAIANDQTSVDKMKRWLLKQKQTQSWSTTKGTADACYALLLQGTQWLNSNPEVTINLGDKTYNSSEMGTEAGTGYFKTKIKGAEIQPEMGNINLRVKGQENSLPSWGAVYWQYFENMDKISAAATPIVVKKQLFQTSNTSRGAVLTPVTENLKIGDKVTARIEIIVDRDMEYVHLKDGRAACFEPTNVLSGYHWQGGLGYYESTKDASSNFFFSYLPKGKYVFEYPLFVTNAGDFSAGLATIQCMYAPEFSAHSEGLRVKVTER